MKKQPLVTVIIPCYNYGHLIHETLESLLAQTYKNWECIIVDDGSTDKSRYVAEEYSKRYHRIKYIYQNNKGLAGARNTGLKYAKGDYIQFLDADDLLCATKLEAQLYVFDDNTEIDIVYGDVYLFEHGKNYLYHSEKFYLKRNPVSGSNEKILQAIVEDNFFLVHCPLVKREKVMHLRFEEHLKALEDWNFWFKCALSGCNFFYLADMSNVVFVRGHGNNMSKDRRRMWYYKAVARENILHHTQQLICEGKLQINNTSASYLYKKHKQYLYLDLLRYHLMFGNIVKGLTSTLKYILCSRQFSFALYDSAYWVKERLKLKLSA